MSKQFTLRIPVSLHEAIQIDARERYTTVHAAIITTLVDYFGQGVIPITLSGLGKKIQAKNIVLRLPEEIYEKVDNLSDMEDRSMNAILVRILRSRFEHKEIAVQDIHTATSETIEL